MARKSRKAIKEELLQQLENNGTFGMHYVDLVEDYMAFWDIKNALIKDIKERGKVVEWQNGKTQKGIKKNESITELQRTNKQMLLLLKELGLRAVDNSDDDEDIDL